MAQLTITNVTQRDIFPFKHVQDQHLHQMFASRIFKCHKIAKFTQNLIHAVAVFDEDIVEQINDGFYSIMIECFLSN